MGVSSMPRASLALRNSRDLLLNIVIPSYSRSIRPPLPTPEFLALVRPHSHRWRSLTWAGDPSEFEQILASQSLLLPRLEALDLQISHPFDTKAIAGIVRSTLHELRLNGLVAPSPSQGLPHLKTFSLSTVRTDMVTSARELINFLASCPALENIELLNIGYNRVAADQISVSYHPSPVIPMPNLRNISLEDVMETLVAELMHTIHAENLANFHLKTGFDEDLVQETVMEALGVGWQGDHDRPLDVILGNIPGGEIYLETLRRSVVLGYRKDGHDAISISVPHHFWMHSVSSMASLIGGPTRLYLHHHRDDLEYDPPPMTINPSVFLGADWAMDITHIYVSSAVGIDTVLKALSVRSEETWPAPALLEVHLTRPRLPRGAGRAAPPAIRNLVEQRSQVQVFDGYGIEYRDWHPEPFAVLSEHSV